MLKMIQNYSVYQHFINISLTTNFEICVCEGDHYQYLSALIHTSDWKNLTVFLNSLLQTESQSPILLTN